MSRAWPFLKFALIPAIAWFGFKQGAHLQRPWLRRLSKALLLFLLAGSLTLLVLSLPTGSIDIADLWLFLGFALVPYLPVLGFRFSSYIKAVWIQRSVKTLTSILLFPAGLFFLFMCLGQSACTRRASPIYSPDGKHIALVEFAMQGALGADYGIVYMRRSWLPFAKKVYAGFGESRFDLRPPSPEVRWLDNSRLLIRFWGRPHRGRRKRWAADVQDKRRKCTDCLREPR